VTFLQRSDTACINQYALSGLRQESGSGITAAVISALHVCRWYCRSRRLGLNPRVYSLRHA